MCFQFNVLNIYHPYGFHLKASHYMMSLLFTKFDNFGNSSDDDNWNYYIR
jgi:hypothetical protein